VEAQLAASQEGLSSVSKLVLLYSVNVYVYRRMIRIYFSRNVDPSHSHASRVWPQFEYIRNLLHIQIELNRKRESQGARG
jgi:hypothetical protein